VRIEFFSSAEEQVVNGDKKYNKLTVTYKNLSDPKQKVEVKNLVDFAVDKDIYSRLKSSAKGDVFQVDTEKKNNFWQWVGLHRDDGSVPPPVETPRAATGAPVRANTYEKNNEIQVERLAFDKEKQALIIRQSCIASAVDLCKDHGKQPNPDQVIEVAKAFENYVYGRGVEALADDVPV
jgi:hypothetical protein